MTVGDKVLALRGQLPVTPLREDCRSFVGRPLYTLGMSFFPADLGLYDPNRESISTLVLGTDWGNEQHADDDLKATTYKVNATVRNTDRMLREAGFDLNDCFYSNAWPVLREGASKEQGHHPMRDDFALTNCFQDYFRATLDILRPKIVISLGLSSAWFLGPFFGSDWLLGKLRSPSLVKTKALDIEPLRVRDGIVFVNATHPSHLHNRDLRHLPNDPNETALLVRARRLADVQDAAGWAEPGIRSRTSPPPDSTSPNTSDSLPGAMSEHTVVSRPRPISGGSKETPRQ